MSNLAGDTSRELPTTQSTPRTDALFDRHCASVLDALDQDQPERHALRVKQAGELLDLARTLERELARYTKGELPDGDLLDRIDILQRQRAETERQLQVQYDKTHAEMARAESAEAALSSATEALQSRNCDDLCLEHIKRAESATEAKQALIEKVIGWAHDGRLQTFEDRERFRKWARALKEPS